MSSRQKEDEIYTSNKNMDWLRKSAPLMKYSDGNNSP